LPQHRLIPQAGYENEMKENAKSSQRNRNLKQNKKTKIQTKYTNVKF